MYCIVLYCIILYCIVLYFFVFYYNFFEVYCGVENNNGAMLKGIRSIKERWWRMEDDEG